MKLRLSLFLCLLCTLLLSACVTTTAKDGVATTSPDGPTVRAVSEAIASLFRPTAVPAASTPDQHGK